MNENKLIAIPNGPIILVIGLYASPKSKNIAKPGKRKYPVVIRTDGTRVNKRAFFSRFFVGDLSVKSSTDCGNKTVVIDIDIKSIILPKRDAAT